MTPEDIKKIAEEYAKKNPPTTDDERLKQTGIALNATMVFEPFLQWLTNRYFLVEKSKVEKERRYYEETEWVESVSISDLMGDIKDTFKQFFGSEIGKEDGNETR